MAMHGADRVNFHAYTRATVDRYVDDMTTNQLLDLLGHLIVSRRNGYKLLMKGPAAPIQADADTLVDESDE